MGLSEITYNTKYGTIIVPSNDQYFVESFNRNEYWGDDEIMFHLSIIDKSKNILEFGSHIGTHTIAYAKNIDKDCIVYSFEPQVDMYEILQKNISNNNLSEKVIAKNGALFYYNGKINMNDSFIDGDFIGNVADSVDINCNYGGLSLGLGGELIDCYKIDDLKLDNLGFIHADAQGSEPFIFWGAKETIKKFRPIIFFEDSNYDINDTPKENIYFQKIKTSYDIDDEISNFDIASFCINELKYDKHIKGYNTYLIP